MQHELLCSLESIALQCSCREKRRDLDFPKWPIAGKSRESVNWSTIMAVKRSSISEFKHSSRMTSCNAREKQGYVVYYMSTCRLNKLTGCSKRTMVLYYSTDYLCFRYKRYVARVFCNFFGHKRSSGRKRYPFPIQAFVAVSYCGGSKG